MATAPTPLHRGGEGRPIAPGLSLPLPPAITVETRVNARPVPELGRRMEDADVIAADLAEVDPAKVGLPVMAVVHMRCDPGTCLLKTAGVESYPEVLEVLTVWGSHCTILKVVATSNEHLEKSSSGWGQLGHLETLVVWPRGLARRPIDWEDDGVVRSAVERCRCGVSFPVWL